jgi:hypothetical protein
MIWIKSQCNSPEEWRRYNVAEFWLGNKQSDSIIRPDAKIESDFSKSVQMQHNYRN